MAKNAAKTRSLVGYTVAVGPTGTTLPTDTTTALDAALVDVGYVSSDGFTKGRQENVSEVFDAAGTLVRTFRSQASRTFTFTALESNATVKALEEPGATVTVGTGITTRVIKDAPPARKAMVLELEDTDTDGLSITTRIAIPEAEITPTGEPVWVDGQIVGYQFQAKTIKQSDGTHYTEIESDAA